MTYFLLIALCVIVLISYVFELTGKFTKIPGVILLVVSGMAANYLLEYLNIKIPDFSSLLPIMGTLGLILIVLEGSLDLTISRKKRILIGSSITSAIVLFVIFEIIFTYILVNFYGIPSRTAIINTIPLGIISSAVAIPSAARLSRNDKEFVTYESSFSDIVGILAFDFILFNYTSIGKGILGFTLELILTIIVSVLFSAGLAYILHKINHHVKYVIITTVIILVYALAKMAHMPSLLVVLIFGLVMNNNHLFKNKYSEKIIDFEGFNVELNSFKNITGELTFIIRSFFFIMFGYYTSILDLLNIENLFIALIIALSIFIIRGLYFKIVLKTSLNPLLFFAPRGLITILLFLSIPITMSLPFINKGLITQVIFITILMMTFGNMFFRKKEV
jgi:Kef-type K+ transport system membrane component KefB